MPVPQISIADSKSIAELRNSTQVALDRLITHLNSAPIDKPFDANDFRITNLQWPANDKDAVNVEYLKDFVAKNIKKRKGAGTVISTSTAGASGDRIIRTFGKGIDRNLATGIDVAPHLIIIVPPGGTTLTLEKILFKCKVAPTGANAIADINFSGTSILSATKLVVPATSTAVVTYGSAIVTDTFSDGDVLTLDIDQIGSSVPGSGFVISMLFRVN